LEEGRGESEDLIWWGDKTKKKFSKCNEKPSFSKGGRPRGWEGGSMKKGGNSDTISGYEDNTWGEEQSEIRKDRIEH